MSVTSTDQTEQTVFRQLKRWIRTEHKALRELDDALRAAEDYDTAAEVHGGGAPDAILGKGDLLDDFVLSACRADAFEGGADDSAAAAGPSTRRDGGAATGAVGGAEDLPEDPEEWDFESAVGSEAGVEEEGSLRAAAVQSGETRCAHSCCLVYLLYEGRDSPSACPHMYVAQRSFAGKASTAAARASCVWPNKHCAAPGALCLWLRGAPRPALRDVLAPN